MEDLKFNGERLVIARQRRALSQAECARLIGVTRQMLAHYEEGARPVPTERLARICEVLGFSVEFFYRPDLTLPSRTVASFRAMSRFSAKNRDRTLAAAALGLEFYEWVDRKLVLPPIDVPSLEAERPDMAADSLRVRWNLGNSPAPSMVHLLEAHGIRVLALPNDDADQLRSEVRRDADGLSLWHNGIPFVFLNTSTSAERSRFDAAHELGHLVLHQRGSPSGRVAEADANLFASTFLMPAQLVHGMIGHREVSLSLILSMKRELGVSAMALVFRLQRLAIISDWMARSLFQRLSANGYRSSEPGGLPREGSLALAKTMAILKEDGIRYTAIVNELGWKAADLYSLLNGLVMVPASGGATDSSALPQMHLVTPHQPLRLVR